VRPPPEPGRGRLASYYAARAAEYEGIYAKPERQADLTALRAVVTACFANRRVLELACGTGYWTAVFAPAARAVVATDIGRAVLTVARARALPDRVRFVVADAYTPPWAPGAFDACFAGFWWSHVPRVRLATFVATLHGALPDGTRVMFVDNRYVEGSSTPIARTDGAGNTYQRRRLGDGSEHEVLKNFPTVAEVADRLRDAGAADVDVAELAYYWYATYTVARRV
jgi:SAM-dependent methyltransferase